MNKYFELISVFIEAAHYKHNTLRFTSDIEPGEEDYIFSKITNHILSVDSMKSGGQNVA